jgi:hypothetical protein
VHDRVEIVTAEVVPPFPEPGPHVQLVTLVDEADEELARAGTERAVLAQDRVVDVEEDAHRNR